MFYLTDIRGIPFMIQGVYYSFADWSVAAHAAKAVRTILKKDIQVHYLASE